MEKFLNQYTHAYSFHIFRNLSIKTITFTQIYNDDNIDLDNIDFYVILQNCIFSTNSSSPANVAELFRCFSTFIPHLARC